jgi:hypothetical protein
MGNLLFTIVLAMTPIQTYWEYKYISQAVDKLVNFC